MSPAPQSTPFPQGLGIPMSDWQRTPISVRDEFLSLLKRVDALEARLHRDSTNSSRPPSTDSAAKKRERRIEPTERRKAGGQPGYPGHQQTLLEPTSTVSLFPPLWLWPVRSDNPNGLPHPSGHRVAGDSS